MVLDINIAFVCRLQIRNATSLDNIFIIIKTLSSQERLIIEIIFLKSHKEGFPGGAVVGNPPASAGDTGSSPDPGRSHVLQST